MKLLFDQNLSYRLVDLLSDVYPRSQHVRLLGLGSVDDKAVWNFAASNGFAIVSKDADFRQRSFLYGAPPKVISVVLGNCSTSLIEQLLRRRYGDIERFDSDPEVTLLILD